MLLGALLNICSWHRCPSGYNFGYASRVEACPLLSGSTRSNAKPSRSELARGLHRARCGIFPTFIWERGQGGAVRDCPLEASERPRIEEFLAPQRRVAHLVETRKDTGEVVARPGREETLEKLRDWTQGNVERLYALAKLK